MDSKILKIMLIACTFLIANQSATAKISVSHNDGILHLQQMNHIVTKQLIDSTPYSGNRVKRNSKKASILKNRTKVRLKAQMPRKLGIANSEVRWTIKPTRGKGTILKRGREAHTRLKPGKYSITLRIGEFKTTKVVRIRKNRNAAQTVPFNTRLGIVKASTNFGSNQDVKWEIKDQNSGKVFTRRGKNIRQIVAAGNYKVTANYKRMRKGRNVKVPNGSIGRANIKVPTGKVKLRAFVGKSRTQPLMTKAKWMIYDSKGKQVGQSHKNNFRVTLVPGKYKAVIYTSGKKKTKSFKVRAGRNSNVVINI